MRKISASKGMCYYMRRGIWLGIVLMLTGCGGAQEARTAAEREKAAIEISPELMRYRNITYGEFREENEQEAEFLHGTFYSAQIDGEAVYAVFSGEYDEETAGAVLTDDAVCLRLEGRLADLLYGMEGELKAEDFTAAITQEGAAEPVYYEEEGAGTAYYVADRYLVVEMKDDGDLGGDIILEISLDESGKISEDSYARIR